MFDWTDARVETLKKLWDDGLSASQIARRMGCDSRNAIIGKIFRLGMSGRRPGANKAQARAMARVRRAKEPRRPAPKFPAEPIPPPQVDDIARVTFADLEDHHCRFIPGEPTAVYCGLEKVPGTSYCAGHLARCCNPPPVKPWAGANWPRQQRIVRNIQSAQDHAELETIT